MRENGILGLHHVTAIASDPQRNLDFYTGVLGLRLVKLTVNFDDPGTYHFYFGDSRGHPGTILTFFPWSNMPRGAAGTGQAAAVSFSVPASAIGFWSDRLKQHKVEMHRPEGLLGEEAVAFHDPDGMRVQLVGVEGGKTPGTWDGDPVGPAQSIRSLHSVTLALEGYEQTADLLTQVMGFSPVAEQGNRFRYQIGKGGSGGYVDVLCMPDARPARMGSGSIHHVAFRTPTDAGQHTWRQELVALGFNVSPVMDRQYFHSIYFREPGGVLFEIATDPPGFTVDEPAASLGTGLKLPTQYEEFRAEIERLVPALKLPPLS